MDPKKISVKKQSSEFENYCDVNSLVDVENDILYITHDFQAHFLLMLLGI